MFIVDNKYIVYVNIFILIISMRKLKIEWLFDFFVMKYNKLKNYYWFIIINYVKMNMVFFNNLDSEKIFIRNCEMRMLYKNVVFGLILVKRKILL